MPDWDEDSPELRRNLARILRQIAQASLQRKVPTVNLAKAWQKEFMHGLEADDPRYVGAFRGEPGLDITVEIGGNWGTPPEGVAGELQKFERKLQAIVAHLDQEIGAGEDLDVDQLAGVIDLCAWAHAEWARIHPFANGNGRTARLWANFLAMRYGLPPFVRLRPRPDGDYGTAGARAMQGDWQSTAVVFREMLRRAIT